MPVQRQEFAAADEKEREPPGPKLCQCSYLSGSKVNAATEAAYRMARTLLKITRSSARWAIREAPRKVSSMFA
jgi:hypothetical protein